MRSAHRSTACALRALRPLRFRSCATSTLAGIGRLTLAALAFALAALAAPAPAAAQSASPVVLIAPTPPAPTLDPESSSTAMQLDQLVAERNAIDIRAITALQWIGAIVLIAGGVTAAIGAILGGVTAIAGNDPSSALGFWCGIGGGGVAAGGLMLGLAELDGNLHRRRGIDGRIRQLREAERSGVRLGLAGLTVSF